MSTAATAIEWCDRTWNPVRGCSRVSPGCDHCYAEAIATRFSGPGRPFAGFASRVHGTPHWTGRVELVPAALAEPLRWRKTATVFVNSMSDLFHEDLSDQDVLKVLTVAVQTLAGPRDAVLPRHTMLALTKRARRACELLSRVTWKFGTRDGGPWRMPETGDRPLNPIPTLDGTGQPAPPDNVWIGVSVEDQATAEERLPHLLRIAALGWPTWVSYEPALGPVDWRQWLHDSTCEGSGEPGAGWECTCSEPREVYPAGIVAGGESGPGARPAHPDWFRQTRDACAEAGVPFFFKQWGDWHPRKLHDNSGLTPKTRHRVEINHDGGCHWVRIGKKAAGRLLDGRTHDELPWSRP